MSRFKFAASLAICAMAFASSPSSASPPAHAEPPVYVYSPDKDFVVAWFDTDVEKHEQRSIILYDLPHGDVPFSLVTSPRDTRVSWSPDSRKCLILDGPDDGGPHTWLFIAKPLGPQPKAIKIEPLKPVQNAYFQKGGDLWRGNITKIRWSDNDTLVLSAWDKGGVYRITIKMGDPNKPVVEKLGAHLPDGY